ncbi:hypothetical protein L3Q82_017912 [Scortum barcoo]|uniref:Uncharacterized protein n=1 Tax=Scortum barcoo TaxID=214431 RepID=A0ACB8VJ57_9TELE|nr:hypothetical protein L3Q82_017912 [Scortum barcoo]
MAAELGSYKQAHTSSPPLTLGNSRVVEGPAPLKELGSRAQAMRGGIGSSEAPRHDCYPNHIAPAPHGPSLRVVSLLEGPAHVAISRAEPGRVPWAKTRPPGAAPAEPQPQAWLQGGAPPALYTGMMWTSHDTVGFVFLAGFCVQFGSSFEGRFTDLPSNMTVKEGQNIEMACAFQSGTASVYLEIQWWFVKAPEPTDSEEDVDAEECLTAARAASSNTLAEITALGVNMMHQTQSRSAFNTIVPSKLVTKLRDLGLNSALCDWILNFLTSRPQAVRMGSTTSSTLTLNTGAPQGCVLSPLLYSLFTHVTATTTSISTSSKTKELIVDFRRRQREEHAPLSPSTGRTTVERVNSSFRFLGVHISEDLTWTHHTDFITKSARTAALLPPQAAEAQHGLQDPLQLLQVHHREYPDWLHHHLVEMIPEPDPDDEGTKISTVKVQGNDISHKLQISRVSKSDEGLYECRVTRANYGEIVEYKAQAWLKVNATARPRRPLSPPKKSSPLHLTDKKPRKPSSPLGQDSMSSDQRVASTSTSHTSSNTAKHNPGSGKTLGEGDIMGAQWNTKKGLCSQSFYLQHEEHQAVSGGCEIMASGTRISSSYGLAVLLLACGLVRDALL